MIYSTSTGQALLCSALAGSARSCLCFVSGVGGKDPRGLEVGGKHDQNILYAIF